MKRFFGGRLNWLLGVVVLGFCAEAFGAEVVYIDPKARFAIIDQGNMHGMAAGTNICVLTADGFIVTCGGVVVANRTKAAIRLPTVELEKIKIGMKITIKAIYLKDDPKPDAAPGTPETFRPAKTPAAAIPGPVRAAAEAKEKEISLADGSAAEAKAKEGAATPENGPVEGKEEPHDVKDPYDDLDKLDNLELGGKDKVKSREQRLADEAARAPPPIRSLSIQPVLLVPLSSIVKYNNLTFATVADDAPPTTMWATKPEERRPKGGAGAVAQIVSRTNKVYTVGFRYLNYLKSDGESGVDSRYPALTSSSVTKVDSTGFWFERGWRYKTSDYTYHDFGVGLDMTVSELTFHSAFSSSESDASGLIATARSKLSILSLRASAAQHLMLGRFIVTLGIGAYSPIRTLRETFSADTDVPESVKFGGDANEDLRTALGHKKNSLAAEATIAGGMQF